MRCFRHSVGRSCRTLLWDTFAGHSRTTLTYADVIWPHKLTVLRPQLPETASRTTFVLQAASSTAPRSCLPHYICTTKRPVLRPQLPQLASSTTCVLQVARSKAQRKLPVHSLLWDTLAELLLDTLVGHDTLVCHSCGTLL